MLGVVSLSIIVGITMGTIRKKVPTLLDTILEFTQVMMKLIQVIIWLTPVGVFFLILAKFIEIDDLSVVFKQLGLYVAVCCGGNLLHGFGVLPCIYFLFTRQNPIKFIAHLAPAIITGNNSIKLFYQICNCLCSIWNCKLPCDATIELEVLRGGCKN
jgi:Na+/H+-dicarboxylate symporter